MKKKHLIFILTLAVIAALIAGLYTSEARINPDYTLAETLEVVLIVLAGEYPEKPQTVQGRIFILGLFLFGILVAGAIIGKISSVFVTRSLLMEKSKMKNFKNHIVICNWNQKAEGIIRQILKQSSSNRDIVIIDTSPIDVKSKFQESENIHFIQDDATHHTVLLKSCAHKAKSVIILADEQSNKPDEKNALIALAIKHLEDQKSINVHIVAELINPNRRRHLLEAGADELVSDMELNTGILAQSALFKNISSIYQRLLTYSDESNEIYFIEPGNYPAEYIGKTFRELQNLIENSKTNSSEKPMILLGVKQDDGRVHLNPRAKSFSSLKEGDSLIVMAYELITAIHL